ncbi:hypothetical protein Ddye_000461 [Dipteronia dyeriana]|uniref:Ribosomal protein S13 n=1 Tax=Dipteronia dyeriana TaxID=168575 RepID=A0AAE0CSK0_9ROSI|nr:hypothetical protein Ddye_000461 [Dipteronia dyeriana]
MASCFGHFLTIHREMKFSGGIIHRLLLRELHHNGPTNEMQFMLGNQSVRFSKVEFCLITGLRFGVVPDTTKYAVVENGIYERQKDYKVGKYSQVVSNALDKKLRDDLERLKKIRNHRGLRHYWGLRVCGQHTKATVRHGKTVGVSWKR